MAKPAITFRSVKGEALTYNELDTNFTNLRDATIGFTVGANTAQLDLNGALSITAGTGISLALNTTTDTLTITNTHLGFSTVAVTGQGSLVADALSDTLTLVAGTGISITTDPTTDTLTIINSQPSPNLFTSIEVSGQSTITPDTTTDVLTFANGNNIVITTNAGTDTITIAATNVVTIDTAQSITGAKTLTGTTTLGPYRESVFNIGNSGSGTVTPNFNNGPVQTIAATGNFTLALPTNISAGSNLTLIITQDSTGGRTFTPNSSYKFANGIKTLTASANAIDVMTIYYDGSRYLSSLIRNYS
jgi:hypothetical protein